MPGGTREQVVSEAAGGTPADLFHHARTLTMLIANDCISGL
jgi:hypothetical protein